MKESVLSVVADEEIIVTIVVVVAHTAALSPAAVREARLCCDIGKRAVAIVLEEMTGWLLSFGKTFKTPSVDEKDIEPAVLVIIVKSDTATGGLQKIFVFAFPAIDGLCVQ